MSEGSSRFELSDAPLDVAVLRESLARDAAGAVVIFEGRVRDENEGRRVARLEYEAYGELARREGEKIVAEALEAHDILAARCVHRSGSLEIGEVAVWIGVATRHRAAGFRAAEQIIDEIKKRVPIWKKEHYSGGDSGWIGDPSWRRTAGRREGDGGEAAGDAPGAARGGAS